MATMQEMERALVNADRAGDTAAARQLALAIKAQRAAQPPAAPAEQPHLSAGEVITGAVTNAIPSTVNLARNLVQPILHPIDTAKGVGNLVASAAGKLGIGDHGPEEADAVGRYFADRYGGVENVRRTLATDPAGLAMDASMLLTGGGSAAARLPGMAGQVGRMAYSAGRAIDPVTNTVKAVSFAAKKAAPMVAKAATVPLGVTTGAGHTAIEQAAKAGFEGGEAGKAFVDNMRGNVPMEGVLTQARTAVSNMRQDRSRAYQQGMAGVKADPTILDFSPVDQAVASVKNRGFFKGKAVNSSAASTWEQIDSLINDWKAADPAEFHTPEGFDALKRAVGDVRDSLPHGSPARNAADTAYNAIKDQIIAQAPSYAKVMKDYEQASALLKEIETALSLGKKASADTALRKLQSVMRNNANTNYGKRVDLAQTLAANGAPNLMPALAGQALSAAQPRGLMQLGAVGSGVGMALSNPTMLPTLLATSPRLVGEAAYYTGKAARGATAPVRAISPLLRGNQQSRAALLAGNGAQQAAINNNSPAALRSGKAAKSKKP